MEEDVGPWKGTNSKVVRGSHPPLCKAFFNNEEFSDVKLFCGRKEYFGHKIILSSCSEVFRTMLSTVSTHAHISAFPLYFKMEGNFNKCVSHFLSLEFLGYSTTFGGEKPCPIHAIFLRGQLGILNGLLKLGIWLPRLPNSLILWHKFTGFYINSLFKHDRNITLQSPIDHWYFWDRIWGRMQICLWFWVNFSLYEWRMRTWSEFAVDVNKFTSRVRSLC